MGLAGVVTAGKSNQLSFASLLSNDSRFLLTHSSDLTARLFSLHPIEGYRPKTFAGHRDGLVGAWIGGKVEDSVSRAYIRWSRT
jgi:hypothetical protein